MSRFSQRLSESAGEGLLSTVSRRTIIKSGDHIVNFWSVHSAAIFELYLGYPSVPGALYPSIRLSLNRVIEKVEALERPWIVIVTHSSELTFFFSLLSYCGKFSPSTLWLEPQVTSFCDAENMASTPFSRFRNPRSFPI